MELFRQLSAFRDEKRHVQPEARWNMAEKAKPKRGSLLLDQLPSSWSVDPETRYAAEC